MLLQYVKMFATLLCKRGQQTENETIVSKSILHTIASNDLGHIVKGVVSVRYVCKLGVVRILAGKQREQKTPHLKMKCGEKCF